MSCCTVLGEGSTLGPTWMALWSPERRFRRTSNEEALASQSDWLAPPGLASAAAAAACFSRWPWAFAMAMLNSSTCRCTLHNEKKRRLIKCPA